MSRVNLERPVARYQPPDWHARNHKLSDSARVKREESLALRKEAQQLRIETDTKTKWHNFDNNMRLSERYVTRLPTPSLETCTVCQFFWQNMPLALYDLLYCASTITYCRWNKTYGKQCKQCKKKYFHANYN